MENTTEMEMAIEAHCKAIEHSQKMSDIMMEHKTVFAQNSSIDGPEYWQLYTKYREAEAAYEAAKVAELAAEKALNELEDAAEAEYHKNHKCTFCGELDSICGGDHSEEMRELSQPRYSRY
jgi:hypothetical protein